MIYLRKWKRRAGVLGKWREIKLAMYQRYLESTEESKHIHSDEPIPE